MNETLTQFQRLVDIMDELRERCPWDQKQTIATLRHLTIEEMYELADAISEEDWKGINEELGDLLLHIVFYARIGKEQREIKLEDVIRNVCDKLIRRHPHIYGEVIAENEEQVKQNWEKIKLQEGKNSVLQGVPKSLPAVVKAIRLQEKSRQVGFEWENKNQVWKKVEEELRELQTAVAIGDRKNIEEEMGDLLFSIVNYSRFLNIDAEHALEMTNKKFIYRFMEMEKLAAAENKSLQDMNLNEMDELWNKIKQYKH